MNLNNARASILFISAFQTTFIQDDIDLLQKHFHVRVQIGRGLSAIFKIIVNSFRSDLIFCWFASVYAFIGVFVSKIIGIKSIIVIGGVDVAKDKELNYGIWLSWWKSKMIRFALRHADLLLVVDPSLGKDAKSLAKYDGMNIRYLPTGHDPYFWKPIGEKESFVLTVALVNDMKRIRIKGIDLLLEAARKFHDLNFLVVGVEQSLSELLHPPPNVKFLSVMARKDLLPLYRQAKVYCQPSRREGLPNTLCEAMLCCCIPVVTEVGGHRTAVGDVGLVVPAGDTDALGSALTEAMTMNESIGINGRARIISLFSKEKRDVELVRIFDHLLQ